MKPKPVTEEIRLRPVHNPEAIYKHWRGDRVRQVVLHLPTACTFHVYRLPLHRDEHGRIIPYQDNEMVARLVEGGDGMTDAQIRDVGRMAIGWVAAFGFDARPMSACRA